MRIRQVAAGLFSLFIIMSFYISCSAGTKEEITSLLKFVEQSECNFVRNGKQHDSLTARQHIEKKYNYYRDQITTTEDFIQYSATGSSLTGKPYKVNCKGISMDSSEWLNTELVKMRAR